MSRSTLQGVLKRIEMREERDAGRALVWAWRVERERQRELRAAPRDRRARGRDGADLEELRWLPE